MTPDQAAELLVLASAYDSRKPDRARVLAWHDALKDLESADCAEAVKNYYRNSREFIMPSDIREGVRAIHRERQRAEFEARPHWRELQPSPPECVPMPDYVKQAWAEFMAARALPDDAA
jgi:hypothetical protein